MFAPKSEKSAKPEPALTGDKGGKGGKGGSQKGAKCKPSERYPNAEIVIRDIELEQLPMTSSIPELFGRVAKPQQQIFPSRLDHSQSYPT